jgi:AcrR family transcriptional regulator
MTSKRHSAASEPDITVGHRVGIEREAPAGAREVPPAVLDAVRDSVMAVGVRRTTLTDVARRAGLSRMTLYRMVPDVETLLLELLTRDFSALLLDVERRVARRRTARGRMVGVVVDVARRLPEEPLFQRIVDVDPELLLPYLTDRLGSTQRFALGHNRRMIAEGQADGSIRNGSPDVMAVAVLFAVTPFIVSARLLDDVGREAALHELERGLNRWLSP